MDPVETYLSSEQEEYGEPKLPPRTVKILVDEDPTDPREWDNLGVMSCIHPRHNLGDEHQLTVDEILELVRSDDVIALPLYLYDHSGITMSTSRGQWPFNCPWDAGQVGYIYISKDKVREEYSWTRISPERRKQVLRLLRSEVETYDQYLRGDVYGYIVENEEGEHIDSCWGYFGIEYLKEELIAMGYPPQS